MAIVLAQFVDLAVTLYSLILIGRILMSWFNPDPYTNALARFLHQATEPVLAPVRRLLPPMAGFDFSPMIVFVGLIFLERVLVSLIYSIL